MGRTTMTSTVRVELGPVPSMAAHVWLSSTLRIVAAVSAHPELVHLELPTDLTDTFTSHLLQWLDVAERSEVFHWIGREDAAKVRTLLTYWVRLDRLSDEEIARLGVSWSPPEGQPFFEALTSGVIEALAETPQFGELAAELAEIWGGTG
jgi:hypothetical protein